MSAKPIRPNILRLVIPLGVGRGLLAALLRSPECRHTAGPGGVA